MTTVTIPAEGLANELHKSEKCVLLLLFRVGGTVRTLVAGHLDNRTYIIYNFILPRMTRERDPLVTLWKPSLTSDVTSVLRAIKKLEQFGLLVRTEADSASEVWNYHENINTILAASIDATLEGLRDDLFGFGLEGLEGILRSELYLTPEGEKMTHFMLYLEVKDTERRYHQRGLTRAPPLLLTGTFSSLETSPTPISRK